MTDTDQTTAVAVPAATSIEALIARAIDKGVPVETMERLLVMRTQLKAEAAREAFIAALADFQATCPAVPRTRTAKIESTRGTYTYNYAKIEDIIQAVGPSLAAHGLSYQFDVRFEANPPAQVVICTIRHIHGHSESSTFTIPVDSNARMNVAQQNGSAQTYAKRYALSNALGIVTADEDDDAHSSVDSEKRSDAPLRTVSTPPPSQGKPVAPPSQRPNRPITDKQLNRLCAIANQAGHPVDDVDQWLNATYHFSSKKQITMDVYDAICNRLAERESLATDYPDPPPQDEDIPF